jgi:hypothetical protein
MSRRRLSDTVIAARMVELRNLRRLHVRDRAQIAALKADNKALRAEVTELRQLLAEAQTHIQNQAIQIAELQTMVFGKRKRRPPDGTVVLALPTEPLPVRRAASYRRPLPPVTSITSEIEVPLPEHCACGGSFDPASVTVHERYAEDIPLPGLTPDYQPHLVTKYVVARGVCDHCGKAYAGRDLGGQVVTLGSNVRLLVSHLVSMAGLSYAQVANLLFALYGLHVSDGEVAGLLQRQYRQWLPAYHRLAKAIRASPVHHYDESPWAIQAEGNAGYTWVTSDDRSENTLFYAATSRGTRQAKRLHGRTTTGVHITDDYGVYRHLPGQQQLCWAHLYRAIRDVYHNQQLPATQAGVVGWWYEQFAAIYEDLRLYLTEPYDAVVRRTQADELWQRVKQLASQPAPPQGEPDKLRRLKAQLLRAGQDRLFVCLPKNTPCDNNRAERDLRQLVLKRQRSFGSKTLHGARALMSIASICTTTWRRNPTGYFRALSSVG